MKSVRDVPVDELTCSVNGYFCIFFFHSCTVHLDTFDSFIYPTDAQLVVVVVVVVVVVRRVCLDSW